MGAALEAGYDLGALALCFLAIALLLATKGLAEALHKALNVGFLGIHPFAGIASVLEGTLIAWLDDAIKGVEAATAKFENGLIDSFGMLLAIPALLAIGTKAALSYMWNVALPAFVSSRVSQIRTLASQALDKAEALSSTVSANLGKAERYAVDRAGDAVDTARSYTNARVSALEASLHADIAAGVSEAEAFANTAVGKLRSAEDNAIAGALEVAALAKAAGLAAAAQALEEAERFTGVQVSQAEALAAGALAQVDAAGKAALAGLEGVVINVGDELAEIEGAIGAAGVGALIASIPAIATLVHAIATEAGLENAECRSKVKGVCGTDPSAWAGLLGGLAALGFAFSLRELAEIANPLVGELAGIIDQAA